MKKFLGAIIAVVVCFCGLVFSACTPNYDNVTLVASTSKIEIAVGQRHTFNFEMQNAPSGMSTSLTLNNINNLFTVESCVEDEGRVFYEIKGLKPGKTTLTAMSHEGGKTCNVEVEVFDSVESFEAKQGLFVVAEDGNRYTLANQSYFNFLPQNCKVPKILYTYDGTQITDIIVQKDETSKICYVKFVKTDGTVLTDQFGQEIRFAQGEIFLNAQALDYVTGNPILEIPAQEVKLQIVPQIEVGQLKLLRKGGILADANKFYSNENQYIVGENEVITIIKNRISDSYLVFEVECDTADVKMEIESSLCFCTQIAPNDPTELENYVSSHLYSKFFSVQANGVGEETIKITLKYTNENFTGLNYEEVVYLKVVSITAPYQVNANNVIEYPQPVTLYDNAVSPYEIFVNVLDKISSFSAVRVSLATKLDDGTFLENEEYFTNLQITYGTQVPRVGSFEIPYTDFAGNTSMFPIRVSALEKFDQPIYVVLTVVPVKIENANDLPVDIFTSVPFEIKEGIKSFELAEEYLVQVGESFLPKTLYFDLDAGAKTFDGFLIENFATATLGNFRFEYAFGADEIVNVEQIKDLEQNLTKDIKITPKKPGTANVRVIAQEGYFVDMTFCVVESLKNASLALLPGEDITSTKTDENGNINYVQVAFNGENKLNFSVVKEGAKASLYTISTEVDLAHILDVDKVEGDQITLKVFKTADNAEIVNFKVKLSLQQVTESFDIAYIEDENAFIEFIVEIYVYSPIQSVEFVQTLEDGTLTAISGLSVYRKVDVGHLYSAMSKAECGLRVTLKNGQVVDDVLSYYDSQNALSIITSYGALVANGNKFFINQFGSFSLLSSSTMMFECDYQSAMTGSFAFMITIKDHNVSYSAQLNVTVKKFTPLEYIGITNYQEQVYLSGTNDEFTFHTYVNESADIKKFEVIFEPSQMEFENLITASVNAEGTEVYLKHTGLVSNGSGYIYFVPRTLFDESGAFPKDRVQKIRVVYSDGSDKRFPELISSAEEFISAVSSTSTIKKHFVIMNSIDLSGYTFENVKALTGSISGGTPNAKITNVNLVVEDQNILSATNNFGLFPRIEDGAELNDLIIEGTISVNIENLGVNRTLNVGLVAGENLGIINNVAIRLSNAQISVKDFDISNKIYIGGMFGQNIGEIHTGVDANSFKDPLVFGFDDTKLNLNTISIGAFSGVYEGQSAENAFGALVGRNLGLISRENISFAVYNNNNHSVIANVITTGFNATGGIAGQNGSSDNSSAKIKNYTISGNIEAKAYSGVGGQNIGGAVGVNYGTIDSVTTRAFVKGQDFVGGLIGFDSNYLSVIRNKVQAVKANKITPMILAVSGNGNIGAFSGNEDSLELIDMNLIYTSFLCQNSADVYYSLDLDNKITPILYQLMDGEYQKAKQSAFTEKTETLEVKRINETTGTQRFDYVYNATTLNFANMFIYLANSDLEQKYIDHKNTNRAFPFVFSDTSTISIVSLNPEILTIDANGLITLNRSGLATIQVTSILDTSVITKVYINVTNAFDKMQIENMAGEKLLSDSYINVYSHSPVSIKYSFTHDAISATGQDGQPILVALKAALDPDVAISYQYADHYYTRAEKYGQLIIFTSTGETFGTNKLNKVTFTPSYTITYRIGGVDVKAVIANFEDLSPNFKAVDFSVLARLGTQKLEADASDVSIEPVDELTITITQTTDEQNDTLYSSFVKVSDEVGGAQDYFKIIKTIKESVYDEENNVWKIKTTFTLKYDYEKYPNAYEGDYHLVFKAPSGVEKTILVTLKSQNLSSLTLKNFYDVDENYIPSAPQSNQVSSGDFNLLEINLYPYFADFDYITIKNDEENYSKNNILLMEVMAINKTSGKLELLDGVVYNADGIIVSKEVLNAQQKIFGGEIVTVFVKYTTISKATVDTVAKLLVSAVKVQDGQETFVMNGMVALNIVIKDSVFFTIENRQEAPEYYLAKGVDYGLSLNLYGFTEDQVKYHITHEGFATNVAKIVKTNEDYILQISQSIPYSSTSQNQEGYEIEITTYGENIVDGIKYQSGESVLKIVIVDFVVLQENLKPYSQSEPILENEYQTIIKDAQGAVVNLPIGSLYKLENQFEYGQTIEYNVEDEKVVQKIKAFEEELSSLGAWTVTATNVADGVLGALVETINITNSTKVSSGFLKIDGKTITPLRVNDYQNTKYYFSFDNSYYYSLGQVKVGQTANSYSLATDFVFDAYPNSTQENAIPVNTYQEFLAMEENGHYILMSDITLDKSFQPIQTLVASFDGNGHKITLPSTLAFENLDNLGLFATVDENAILKNITIEVPALANISITLPNSAISFGMIAGENNGMVTNCRVVGKNNYSQLAISIPNQTSENAGSFVAGLIGRNNGYITNSSVSVNLTAATNVSGFVGVNSSKISSSFVRDSMIVNKSAFSATHKTAGFVVVNGASGNQSAQITNCYVTGEASKTSVYSVSSEKAINSMPSASGFVYTNYNLIQDCYSDIYIKTSSTSAGFLFENSGPIVRSYTTSTFSDTGTEAYIFVRSNSVESARIGTYEDCFYLVGSVNKAASKQLLTGLTALDDADFANKEIFKSFAISSNINKHEGIWFYPSRDVETSFKDQGKNMTFTYGKPELVSANVLANTKKILDVQNTKLDTETGETIYSYIETAEAIGTKFNPILIYSAESFENQVLNGSLNNKNANHYRLICDINYIQEGVYTSNTYKTIFTGTFEGNSMKIAGFSIDYRGTATNAGLFAQIGSGTSNNGVVKNLSIAPNYINLPNVSCVGALAGRLESGRLFNITADGFNNQTEGIIVLGKNAVGGVVGFASNSFKMMNIVSSVSVNATYSHKKSSQDFKIYQTSSDIKFVSYAGVISGIMQGGGEVYDAKVENKAFAMAEICGLVFGLVGANVNVDTINQNLTAGQFITPSVYGGVIAGSLYGTLTNVNAYGQADADFIKRSQASSTPATASGGLVGLMIGGTLEKSELSANLVWNQVAPLIVGGLVGEMIGGSIYNSHFAGEQITTNASNNVFDVVESTVGGIVGKIAPNLSIRTPIQIENSDVTFNYVSSKGVISVNLVNVLTAHIGGIAGQVVQEYDWAKHTEHLDGLNKIYKTLPAYKIEFNQVSTVAEITYKNTIYGGVLKTYVGGLIGAIFSDESKLYEGEVIMQDNASELEFMGQGKYQSISNAKINLQIVDNKSTAQIVNYYGGIVGYGKTVKTHTTLLGKYDEKTKPWGVLLKASQIESNFTSPEFAGKWADAEKTTLAVFKNTEFMTIKISSPISGTITSNEIENVLKAGA